MSRNKGGQSKQNKQATSKERSGGAAKPEMSNFDKVGPRSIEGLEASELPDKGRGDVFTNPGKEGKRNLPQNTGETTGPGASHQTGLRGDPDVADAAQHGHRKRS